MRARVVLVAAMVAVGLAAASSTADARQRHVTGSVSVHGSSVGGTEISAFVQEFDHDPQDVAGDVHADRRPAGVEVAPASGPAVCLDVRGRTAGGIYMIDQNSQPPGTFIYVTFVDGGPGRPDRIGFTTPLPRSALGPGCAPRPELALFTFDGDVVITDDGSPGHGGR